MHDSVEAIQVKHNYPSDQIAPEIKPTTVINHTILLFQVVMHWQCTQTQILILPITLVRCNTLKYKELSRGYAKSFSNQQSIFSIK